MSSVVEKVVKQDLCIGCGLCVPACKSNALSMSYDEQIGMQIPVLTGKCDSDESCIKICPFNPFPEKEVGNENLISKTLNLDSYKNEKNNKNFGKYKSLYAGFSNEFRSTSSSGGIATWILFKLLKENVVDSVIVVDKSNTDSDQHYNYKIISGTSELKKVSETKYYPLTLNEIIENIATDSKTYAITAIPCFLKAIRLKQYYDKDFKNKIKFTIGIFCGGLKTSFFTEYLSSKCKVEEKNIKNPKYRIKDHSGSAIDYSFGVEDKSINKLKKIKMKDVGDMWGTGLFKPTACEFCDDLSSELADISLGDAWIPPYNKDGRGSNIIITRSLLADGLIKKGLKSRELLLDIITEEQAELSQKGNINHRRKGLAFRLYLEKFKSKDQLIKRVKPTILINPFFALVLLQRQNVRKNSFLYWEKYRNAEKFDKAMSKSKFILKVLTKMNSKSRKIISKLR